MAARNVSQFPGATEEPRLLPLSALLGDLRADANAAHEAYSTGTPRGPHIFLPKLAQTLDGAWSTGVHVLHGVPGAGKTAWGLQAAAQSNVPTLYVSAEMSILELVRRLIARSSGEYLGRLRGELSGETMERLALATFAKSPHLAFVDATQVWPSTDWLKEAALSIVRDSPYLFIVVDSLHSWAEGMPVGNATEYDTLNTGLAALRKLAGVLSCAVLVIAERNRMSMKGGGQSAGAGTRKIEYSAETVLDLVCDDEAEEDGAHEKPVELRVVKNRNGKKAPIQMTFNGALMRFKEW
jgi:replicative DNA helicase